MLWVFPVAVCGVWVTVYFISDPLPTLTSMFDHLETTMKYLSSKQLYEGTTHDGCVTTPIAYMYINAPASHYIVGDKVSQTIDKIFTTHADFKTRYIYMYIEQCMYVCINYCLGRYPGVYKAVTEALQSKVTTWPVHHAVLLTCISAPPTQGCPFSFCQWQEKVFSREWQWPVQG